METKQLKIDKEEVRMKKDSWILLAMTMVLPTCRLRIDACRNGARRNDATRPARKRCGDAGRSRERVMIKFDAQEDSTLRRRRS
jgi:hypothetical protein